MAGIKVPKMVIEQAPEPAEDQEPTLEEAMEAVIKPEVAEAPAEEAPAVVEPEPAAPEPEEAPEVVAEPATTPAPKSSCAATPAAAPKLRVEPTPEPAAAEPVPQAAPKKPAAKPAASKKSAKKPAATAASQPAPERPAPSTALGSLRSASGWLKRTFPGHEHTFLGAVIGLIFALLVFAIGPLRTLFVALLMGIGACVGLFLDGDPRIMSAIRRIFRSGQDGQ